jgi:PilZ domain
MPNDERRVYQRYKVTIPVKLTAFPPTSSKAQILELSASGCYIKSQVDVELESKLKFQIGLIGYGVEFNGTVKHFHIGIGFGIKFLELSPLQLQVITRLTDLAQFLKDSEIEPERGW